MKQFFDKLEKNHPRLYDFVMVSICTIICLVVMLVMYSGFQLISYL